MSGFNPKFIKFNKTYFFLRGMVARTSVIFSPYIHGTLVWEHPLYFLASRLGMVSLGPLPNPSLGVSCD